MPKPEDFLPQQPWEGPPLPRSLHFRWPWKGASPFSVNPTWLPPETREEFLKSYGEYATKTAEAFAPVGDVETARMLARTFYERITTALVR